MKKNLLIIFILNSILFANQAIKPLPTEITYNKEKAKLGKKLFFDTMLSRDYSVACISCHNVYNGGADPRKVSIGYAGKKGNIQSPTVLNAVYNFRQFWNGRAKNLKEQAAGPLNNPVEHNMTPKLIEHRLKKDETYSKEFKKIYKNGVSYDNVLDAIVEFEKALVTPNAKFDRYLRGEVELSKDELNGYNKFKQYGCISCHNGKNIGGNSFSQIGTFIPYKNERSYPDRYEITKKPYDRNVFKTPTLRNIELTAPYFHDGSKKTLYNAIKAMAYYNLGIEMPKKDIKAIEIFLKTLTGELPKVLDE